MIKKKTYFVDSIVVYKDYTSVSSLRQKFNSLVAKEQEMDQENRLSWAASFMYHCIILNLE